LTFCSDQKDIVQEKLEKQQLDYNKENFEFFKERKKVFSSLIDMSSKFENITTELIKLADKTYIFNLIEVDRIEVLTHRDDHSQIFYLIRLNDKNALFISELDKKEYESDPNLCQYFYKIYSKLEPVKEETRKKILLPAFAMRLQNQYMCPNLMPMLTIEKELENYEISRLYEYTEISMDYDLEYDNSVYGKYDTTDTYTIKNNFIFGILNYDILSELNIPNSYITYVSQADWKEKK